MTIKRALSNKPIPIYGNGQQIRDWLHVEDHISALILIMENSSAGERYNIGGNNQTKNIDLVKMILSILDEKKPLKGENSYQNLISFVTDRPGHDTRYHINCNKLKDAFGWQEEYSLKEGLERTVEWYLNNQSFLT